MIDVTALTPEEERGWDLHAAMIGQRAANAAMSKGDSLIEKTIMVCEDKAEAREALELSREYAKTGIRFFPMLIADDEEIEQLAMQNLQRAMNSIKKQT